MSFRFLSVGQTLTSSEHFVIGSPYDYENDDDNNDDKNEDDYDYSDDDDYIYYVDGNSDDVNTNKSNN